MKKILSMLVLTALLLTTLAISASAAAYYDYGNTNARINVKKSTAVKIDGVISEGEYSEYTDGYTEWYVAENASDYFDDAEVMGTTAKWYFSWDGEYLNIAAQWNAGCGADQTFAGGDYYGDYAFVGTDEFIVADDFLGYGPGINVVSGEMSADDDQWTRTFVAISENTSTGDKIIGMYSGQNGQNKDYKPAWTDFEFTYDGSMVTAEYRIPVIELLETFKPNQAGQMFKASIVLQAGVAGQFATDAETGEEIDIIPANYGWGVRLGQLGYCSDSGNTEKQWATFRLVDEEVEGQPVTTPDPIIPPVDDNKTPVDDNKTPVDDNKTPVDDNKTPVDDNKTPVDDNKTPVDDNKTPVDDNKTPVDDNKTPVDDNKTPVAPETGDIMVVAAVVSAISACGVMFAKKRR